MDPYLILGLAIAAIGAIIGIPIALLERARTHGDPRQQELPLREKRQRRHATA